MPKEKLYQQIYEDLLCAIQSGVYRQGDKLPTEYELMARYGVGRITAITAMKKLEQDNLVRRIRKRGSFVHISVPESKTFNFALVLPYNDIFNYDIIQGAQSYGLTLNCSVPFYNTLNSPEREREILQTLLDNPCDGIMLYPCSKFENIDIVSRFHNNHIPIVYMDRGLPGTDDTVVTSDNTKGIFRLVSGLIEGGCRNVGYYGVSGNMISTETERFTGYCSALRSHGLEIKRSLIYAFPSQISTVTRYSVEGDTVIADAAEKLFAKLIQKNHLPEAVCCVNDLVAVSVIRAARKFGLSVPEDIAVTGFDNISLSCKITPALTTVEQNFYQLGRTALDCLYKIVNGESCAKRIDIDTKLIVRSSAPVCI